MNSHILQGDALERLRELPDESVDTVITDPPYGYSFMGKDWDKAVPSVEIWQECLRVLKPGAFACVMSAPRSDVQNAMISRLMEAGFRLDFTPIYWTYASGFPKAGNVGKLVDKRLGAEREVTGYENPFGDGAVRTKHSSLSYAGKKVVPNNMPLTDGLRAVTSPATPQAKALDGSYTGFQPKPAVEVIIVAMKPLSEKTYVDQALKNGKGITWLDDCRVPATSEDMGDWDRFKGHQSPDAIRKNLEDNVKPNFAERVDNGVNNQGRFPANLLVSDDVLNDGVERHKAGNKKPMPSHSTTNTSVGQHLSDFSHSGEHNPDYYGDSGSYSRYFDLDKWAAAHLTEQQMKTFPFAIFPKASKSEKNKGLEHLETRDAGASMNSRCATCGKQKLDHEVSRCKCEVHIPAEMKSREGMKNHHPTVKPLKLMSYLITLFSREGDTVLDPFVGSGTTVVAAEHLNRVGIGIEREAEYAEIARARLAAEKSTVKQATLL